MLRVNKTAGMVLVAAVVMAFSAGAQPAKQLLPGHMPAVARGTAPVGRIASTRRLDLAVGLPLRNEEALNQFLRDIADPASPEYRHYVTPEEFARRFGPTEQDYQAAANFFQTNGFTVSVSPNRMVLDISSPAADVERVFHTTLRTYPHPLENRVFFAPDTEPSIDLSVRVLHVSGLDDFTVPRPKSRRTPLSAAPVVPHAGSSSGHYVGNDFRAAYLPGIPTNRLSGAGQVIGLLEFDGYFSNDIVKYETIAGLPPASLTNVSVHGGVSSPGPGNGEVTLDIQVALAVAPSSRIVVYEAPQTTSWATFLNAIANDTVNGPKQISCSWGNTLPSGPDNTSENLFKQMAAQGQSFFNASGDGNSFVGGIPFPSESTNITQVGGTTLSTTGPKGVWMGETVWNWGASGTNGTGSSGGVSVNFNIPTWQQGLSMTANLGSTTKRNVPDVAMTADNILSVADNGTNYVTAGTSAAAPLWAGFLALVNQQAAAGGKPSAGFINPAIYAIGKSTVYLSDFNDIVTGNNFWSASTNKFPAVPGYDLCTGWGSPTGDNLIDALAGVSDPMAVAPGKGFVSFGAAGGPFTVTTQTFVLTNAGGAPANWSLVNTSAWLTASTTGGILTTGTAATTVTCSLNPIAATLPPGTYTAHVWFTNTGTHIVRDRPFALLVGQQLFQNNGFETGTLSYWSQSGGQNNSFANNLADDGSATGLAPHSGFNFLAFGAVNAPGFVSQTVPTVPGQMYLLSFWLTNPVAGGSPGNIEQFVVNWNTNTSASNNIFSLLNPPKFNWTNQTFLLTATSTNTTVAFGGRNDPSFFGLDDVSLVQVPLPSINATTNSNGNFIFAWNSLSNFQYIVQGSTNLSQTNWTSLVTNTAGGNVLAFTNSFSNSTRFYRVRRLP